MFKKYRQDCKRPKNAQFDKYVITSKFFKQILMKFYKKFENFVTNTTTKKNS